MLRFFYIEESVFLPTGVSKPVCWWIYIAMIVYFVKICILTVSTILIDNKRLLYRILLNPLNTEKEVRRWYILGTLLNQPAIWILFQLYCTSFCLVSFNKIYQLWSSSTSLLQSTSLKYKKNYELHHLRVPTKLLSISIPLSHICTHSKWLFTLQDTHPSSSVLLLTFV